MWSTTSLVLLPLPGVQVACHQPLINERAITHSEIVSAVSCLNISREENLQLTSHTEARKHLCVQCYVMLQAFDGRWYTALSCDLPTRLTTSEVDCFHLHGCWILLPFLQSLITLKKFFDMFSVSPAILPWQWFEHFGCFFCDDCRPANGLSSLFWVILVECFWQHVYCFADGSSSGDDKNVHISSVPKGTTQELLLLTFPTSHAIRMPREGSDNG